MLIIHLALNIALILCSISLLLLIIQFVISVTSTRKVSVNFKLFLIFIFMLSSIITSYNLKKSLNSEPNSSTTEAQYGPVIQ